MIADAIKRIENADMPLTLFLPTFFGISLIRFVLESFASPGYNGPFYGFIGVFFHFPIWFASVFVWLAILLSLLTKESVRKIAKIQIFIFPIILFPPLFDLLATGVGVKIFYIFASTLGELKDYFLRFFFKDDISLGLRLECAAILGIAGAYVYLKTKKIPLVFIAVIGAYSILFLHGSFPSFPLIAESFGGDSVSPYLFYKNLSLRQDLLIGENYLKGTGFSERSEIFFNVFCAGVVYVSLIVGLAVFFFLSDRKKFFAFFVNVRPARLFHYWLLFFIGAGVAYLVFRNKVGQNLDFYNLLGLAVILLSIAFAWLRSVFENDVYDLEADRISNPERPLVKGEVSAEEAKKFGAILFGLSVVGALIVSYHAFVFVLLAQAIAFIYSSPPLQLKRFFIVNPVLIALASVSMIFNGFFWLAPAAKLNQFPVNFLLAALIMFCLGANFKDIKDAEGDKKAGVRTVLTVFGEKKGKFITGALFFLAAFATPFILREPVLSVPAAIFGIAGFFLINAKQYREKFLFLVYFLYIFSIVLFYFWRY